MQLKFALVKMEQELRVDMTDKQRAYLDKLNLRGKQLANPSLQLESAAMLGKPKTERISKEMRLAVLQAGGVCRPDNVCDFYERFRIHGEVFHATSYSRVSKRNNCVVLLESERVFLIESALVLSNECFIAGHYYQERKDTKLSSVDLPHFRILKSTPSIVLQCIRPSDIVSKLINFTVQVSPQETLNLACINILLMEMLT